MALKFIALSGTTSVTHNLYVYEQNDEILVVDCGIGFPDIGMRGIDLVLPDFSYIVKNKNKLKGIILSHGHEDHIGAIPFLMREVKAEVWATKLVAAFLKDKLAEYQVPGVKINVFDPEGEGFSVGSFKINSFRATHSIPDCVGYAIDTNEGRVFHVPEHKIDQNPPVGRPFDLEKSASLAKDVLFLASDSLGANRPGFVENEGKIEDGIYQIVKNAQKSVFVSAISSNIGRFQQVINVAEKTGRKVAYIGWSIKKKCEIARDIGYLNYKSNTIVNLKNAGRPGRDKMIYLIAGVFGQIDSSLYKLALDEHPRISIETGDTVIFSQDPAPPYTKEAQDFLIDNFLDKGADVHYYDSEEDIYISGHGGQGDIVKLFEIVKPKYFAPVGGTIRFMHAYEKLAVEFGAKAENVFKLKPGESIIFENGNARRGPTEPVKKVLVDGLGIGDVGKVVLDDRQALSQGGVVVGLVNISKERNRIEKIDIRSRGFIFEKEGKGFINDAIKSLEHHLIKSGLNGRPEIEAKTKDFLEKYFFKVIGRNPIVISLCVEV
jgi:ribonuclease J